MRPIREIRIWNRTPANAPRSSAAGSVSADIFAAQVAADPRLSWLADIVSSATISTELLLKGALLKPGTHVDLVGGFTRRCARLDDLRPCAAPASMSTHPRRRRQGGRRHVRRWRQVLEGRRHRADLHELARGEKQGRESAAEITLFAGRRAALEDPGRRHRRVWGPSKADLPPGEGSVHSSAAATC